MNAIQPVKSSVRRLERTDVGRRPSKNPKGVHIGVRLDDAMTTAIDEELARIAKAHPGLVLNRSLVIRMLITEALATRKKK